MKPGAPSEQTVLLTADQSIQPQGKSLNRHLEAGREPWEHQGDGPDNTLRLKMGVSGADERAGGGGFTVCVGNFVI